MGNSRLALVAAPPSPEYPGVPLPATVVMMPLVSTLRMRLLYESAIYRLPEASKATPWGSSQAGVGGRAAVPGITSSAIARHGGDDAVGVHLANAVVVACQQYTGCRAASKATPEGQYRLALVAAPPSPE